MKNHLFQNAIRLDALAARAWRCRNDYRYLWPIESIRPELPFCVTDSATPLVDVDHVLEPRTLAQWQAATMVATITALTPIQFAAGITGIVGPNSEIAQEYVSVARSAAWQGIVNVMDASHVESELANIGAQVIVSQDCGGVGTARGIPVEVDVIRPGEHEVFVKAVLLAEHQTGIGLFSFAKRSTGNVEASEASSETDLKRAPFESFRLFVSHLDAPAAYTAISDMSQMAEGTRRA